MNQQQEQIFSLFSLKNRVAIITGGAGFLGKQHAKCLAQAGATVVLWDYKEEALKQASQELSHQYPNQIYTKTVDIAHQSSIVEATTELKSKFDCVHVLINNASLTIPKGKERQEKFSQYFDPFETYPLDMWKMALDVNLTGTFLVTQTLAPLLLKSPGKASIINIASDVGVISPDHRIYEPNLERNYEGVDFNTTLSYSATKAALIHMTKYWATYWAKKGIRVNAISPAGIFNNQNEKFMRELTDRIPLGRMGKPHELMGAILYLASDASSFVTGTNMIVDGGRTSW